MTSHVAKAALPAPSSALAVTNPIVPLGQSQIARIGWSITSGRVSASGSWEHMMHVEGPVFEQLTFTSEIAAPLDWRPPKVTVAGALQVCVSGLQFSDTGGAVCVASSSQASAHALVITTTLRMKIVVEVRRIQNTCFRIMPFSV